MGAKVNTLRVMAKPLAGGSLAEYFALVARDRSNVRVGICASSPLARPMCPKWRLCYGRPLAYGNPRGAATPLLFSVATLGSIMQPDLTSNMAPSRVRDSEQGG